MYSPFLAGSECSACAGWSSSDEDFEVASDSSADSNHQHPIDWNRRLQLQQVVEQMPSEEVFIQQQSRPAVKQRHLDALDMATIIIRANEKGSIDAVFMKGIEELTYDAIEAKKRMLVCIVHPDRNAADFPCSAMSVFNDATHIVMEIAEKLKKEVRSQQHNPASPCIVPSDLSPVSSMFRSSPPSTSSPIFCAHDSSSDSSSSHATPPPSPLLVPTPISGFYASDPQVSPTGKTSSFTSRGRVCRRSLSTSPLSSSGGAQAPATSRSTSPYGRIPVLKSIRKSFSSMCISGSPGRPGMRSSVGEYTISTGGGSSSSRNLSNSAPPSPEMYRCTELRRCHPHLLVS